MWRGQNSSHYHDCGLGPQETAQDDGQAIFQGGRRIHWWRWCSNRMGSRKSQNNHQRRQTSSHLSCHSTMVKNSPYRVSFIITYFSLYRIFSRNNINTVFQLYVVLIRPFTAGFITSGIRGHRFHVSWAVANKTNLRGRNPGGILPIVIRSTGQTGNAGILGSQMERLDLYNHCSRRSTEAWKIQE